MARKQSEIASATRRATWLVYSNRALRNVIFMPAYDAVDHWLRRRLVAYLHRTLIPVRQSEFMLQLKIKKAATDRSQHAWSGSSLRRHAVHRDLFVHPGETRPAAAPSPGTERDLSIWEIRLIVVEMSPLSGCCARLATAGPAPSASGPTAGPSTRELLVRPAPQRTTLRCASNLLAGAALRHRDGFGIAVAVGALIGSTVRRWFRGVRDPHTQWLYRRAWTAPAARPCNAQPCRHCADQGPPTHARESSQRPARSHFADHATDFGHHSR